VVPLSDTTLLYDSAQAGRCVQAVTSAAQACGSVDITTCYDAFVGNIPLGAACNSSFECAPGQFGFAVCGSDGTCGQPGRGALGQPCSYTCIEDGGAAPRCHSLFYGPAAGTAAACHSMDGLVCAANSTGGATCEPLSADCKQNPTLSCPAGELCNQMLGQCFVPVPVGGSCATTPCGSDGYCAAGVCYPVKPLAATCMDDIECQSGKCTRGLCVSYSQAAADWCGESTVAQ
jgi:hypothetical protein